ncbi:MAG: Rpn family recombination-promoting nuclease/putative transposase [Clostridium sp.]|nr:Rpn family recombination-promoting nuclease/putative transposase [Clostridium sp.]
MAKKNFGTIETNKAHHDYKKRKGAIRYRLTNDYMFRAVMQKNKNVLKHLVCAITGLDADTVTDLDICNPIELGEQMNSKTCVLDIKLLLNKKQYINIEMQIVKQRYWKERSLTYLCRTYNNLDEGQDYADAIPALQISILDFDLFEDVEELLSRYYLINENPEYYNRYSDDLGIFVLNLRQIDNEKVIKKEGQSELYQWAKLFRAESWEELSMLAKKNEAIDECVYTMAQLSEDEKIRMQCEARKDNLAIEIGIRKRAMREGHAEGLAEGHAEGHAEGLAEGQEQGSLQRAYEIAQRLLDILDKPTIAEKTGLSLEEVEALEQER